MCLEYQTFLTITLLFLVCFNTNSCWYCSSSFIQPQRILTKKVAPSSSTKTRTSLSSSSGFGDLDRRSIFRIAGTSIPFLTSNRNIAKAVTASDVQEIRHAANHVVVEKPLADVPLMRLRLPKGGFGREYVVIKLKIKDKGPFYFMVDTGLTIEMMSPHLVQSLGINPSNKSSMRMQGLAAGGSSSESVVEFSDASLCCSNGDELVLPLPTLHAVVTDFPQEHIDPALDPVEGMLGMELLDMFDVEFDFPNGRLRLWAPGTAARVARNNQMIAIPDAVINDTGLLGVRLTSTKDSQSMKQPVLGIIDTGASFSTINWAAAPYLGLPVNKEAYKNSPKINGIGIDGKPIELATTNMSFTFLGDSYRDTNTGQISFQTPPSNWKPWNEVIVALGDLPVFSQLLGDGVHLYNGPAVLLGLDVLSQRRIILETDSGRKRNLYISPN